MPADTRPRPPSLNILSSSSPARPISTSPSPHLHSQSPFRYVHFTNEKALDETPLSDLIDSKPRSSLPTSFPPQRSSQSRSSTSSISTPSSSNHHTRPNLSSSAIAGHPSPWFLRQPATHLIPNHNHSLSHSICHTRYRGSRVINLVKPWMPVILYAMTSIGFVIAIAFWKTEVFTGEFFMTAIL
jgi:hypothetical protein